MARKVNIVGAGFVGLTLAEVLSRQDSVEKITIIDVSESRINDLKEGHIPVKEEGMKLDSEKINYTSKFEDYDGDIFFICVGTPNNNEGVQIRQFLDNAFAAVSNVCKKATFILKSTTTPDNIDELKKFIDPLMGHFITNPEFMAEGKAVDDLLHQHQLIIGTDEEDKSYAENLLKEFFDGTYETVSTIGLKEAMVVKYFLNSYKAQKLNFINDFNWYCGVAGLKFGEVLKAINDPVMGEGFDKPGIGFGGSCFPKDTAAIGRYVASCAYVHKLNESRIKAFADLITPEGKSIILIGGKAFKSGTNDTRESVSVKVANYIKANNNEVHVYFYDALPELSDLTIDEIRQYKDKFDLIILFNNLPELKEVFGDSDKVWDTRSID